ncbi:MAG: plasma-membrane proton-efflux P-type ATPase [Caldiserica bacterium]|jgi:H+-transporting ATPase|nr:plasma-membrane proton-efflux P-type ATPase [Caldisericota bacterium]MDH7562392.1 plasma-membrane proton-efflux P-type ATPase [Caldisericota bacterium]
MKFKPTRDLAPLSLEEAFQELESSPEGLSEEVGRERLSLWGFNETPQKEVNPALSFLLRFWGPMPWLLEAAIILSFLLGRRLEGFFILSLLFINATLGFFHQLNSTKALELLKKAIPVKARVLRDGELKIIPARELVPGDVILLKQGDFVPADLKVISGVGEVDQSTVTGESLPVPIQEGGILYSGSIFQRGSIKALVLNTGTHSQYGASMELVRIARPKSHQEELILKVIKYSLLFALSCTIGATIYGFIRGGNLLQILEFDLVVLMGAVPVAIPVMLSVVQSAGAIELSRNGVLVTRLDSIEDAASCDILLLDKTGTLTENKIKVAGVAPLAGKEDEVLLWAGVASEDDSPDQIDKAILEEARKREIVLSSLKRISFTPFLPETRISQALVEKGGEMVRVVKGAPQALTGLFPLEEEKREDLRKMVENFSQKGARSIAVALEKEGKGLVLGVIGLFDPPRGEAKDTIRELKQLGVKPIMLTGDNLMIAKEIANLVGIGPEVRSFSELKELPDQELASVLENLDGISEVFPEDKFRIVKALQEKGHFVGMTGDGVNDAPALKQAELGIAVENATDVARASSGVVLTKPGIQVILNCLILSRKIFQRTLTWILNKIIKVIEFSALLTLGFFALKTSVLPLLYMAFLIIANDFVTISLATDRVEYSGSPNFWNVKSIAISAIVPGLLFFLEDALVFFWGISHLPLPQLQTLILMALVFNSQVRILLVRERRHFWSSLPGTALSLGSILTVFTFFAFAYWGVVLNPIPIGILGSLSLFLILGAFLIDFPKVNLFSRFLGT